MRLLASLLKKFVQNGTFRLFDSKGRLHSFGGHRPGPTVTARINQPGLETRLFLNPELRVGEAYMDGSLTFEEGSSIHDMMLLFSVNRSGLASHSSQKLLRRAWRVVRRWQQANPVGVAARNARHHYDISTDVYRLFLDEDLQYSCAYFRDPTHDSLEDAQRYKLIHATTKLQLQPGMSVCEIGSGWGGFAIHLAKYTGAYVTAANVSPEQIRVAKGRAAEAGVASQVEFREIDYRNLEGQFDRVVSVGMMEHVGISHFDEYFAKIRDLLKDDGYAFIHSIGQNKLHGTTGPFIRKYIFPGAYVPALSEVFASTERHRLWVGDAEILRLHYTHTIRHWRERFAKNRIRAKEIYDERFCRMWEYYLSAVELEFLHGSHMVFQILVAKTRDAIPIRRDYMFDAERAALRELQD